MMGDVELGTTDLGVKSEAVWRRRTVIITDLGYSE